MSKSIFVFETPKCCDECPCITESLYWGCTEYYFCGVDFRRFYTDEDLRNKPKDCPLKQMPTQKTEEPFVVDSFGNVHGRKEDLFAKGYNTCLKDILGE